MKGTVKETKKCSESSLFETACEKYYKVFDFDPKTKKSDRVWIRVGLIPDPNKEIQWNFFNGERLLCDEPFDKAEVFKDGTSIVIRNHEYNVLRDNGTLVFSKWYHYVSRCEDGKHYIVEEKLDDYGLVRKEAFADSDGEIISEWYDQIFPQSGTNLYCISKGDKIPERKHAVYSLDKLSIVSDWYDQMMLFMWKDRLGKSLARVKKGNFYNLIDTDCKEVFEIWSKKPIEVADDGSCQLFSEDGISYNANAITGKISKI